MRRDTMPNHVYNRLSAEPIPGTETDFTKETDRLIGLVKGEKTPLDFNKIIPMPNELGEISVGGNQINGITVRLWRNIEGKDVAVDEEERERLQRDYCYVIYEMSHFHCRTRFPYSGACALLIA